MSSDQPEWRALKFGSRIFGIYKLPGMSQWRYLKEKGGEKKLFPTQTAARDAARERALSILFPKMTSSLPVTEKGVADKLGVEAWLKTKREDLKKAQTIRKAGRRSYTVIKGKVGA